MTAVLSDLGALTANWGPLMLAGRALWLPRANGCDLDLDTDAEVGGRWGG